MLDLFLIIMLIVSFSKPDVLLTKKMKEAANDEQKAILTKNFRKIYAVFIGLIESLSLIRYFAMVGIVLSVVCLVLVFVISIPAIKENNKIVKELN